MAIPKIKATYSLDEETVRLLERLARQWDVSKSEALRRVIRSSAGEARGTEPTAALDRLQQSLGLTEAVTAAWKRHARAERHVSLRCCWTNTNVWPLGCAIRISELNH